MSNQFFLRTVRAFKGGAFAPVGADIGFETKGSAMKIARTMQIELDGECHPCRVYVLDAVKVPVAAAFAGCREH